MNKYLTLVLAIILIGIVSSCGNKTISIEGLDTNSWKADSKGCKGLRVPLETEYLSSKDKLKGYSQKEIMSILGRPDEVELYKRSQKFFIYYIQPGPGCEKNDIGEHRPKSLFIRFSALDISNEIFVKSSN